MSIKKSLRQLNSREIKRFSQLCAECYGGSFSSECLYFYQEHDHDVYLISADVHTIPFDKLRVNTVGLYVANVTADWKSVRLSIEGAQLLGPHATHHVLELDQGLLKSYLFGDELAVSAEHGWYIVKIGSDFVGCGLVKDGILRNYTPKGRRISSKE